MDIKLEPFDGISPLNTSQETNLEDKSNKDGYNIQLTQESFTNLKREVVSTDVKEEDDADWQIYQNEFHEGNNSIKIEKFDIGECSSDKKTTDQFATSGVENLTEKQEQNLNIPHKQFLFSDSAILIEERNIKKEKIDPELVPVISVKRMACFDQNFVCRVCYAIFPTPVTLKTHKMYHSGSDTGSKTHERVRFFDKTYACQQCDFKSAHMASLKTHERSHRGEKPFECNQCNYKSKQQSNLNLHKKIHNGEKPFKCEICEYRCARSFNLHLHIRSHTGERPYACDQCEYKSSQASGLKRHKMSHSGEKPYKCDRCDYQCARSSLFKSHQKYHSIEQL